MTLNELIKKATQISRMLTSGDIPVTINGKQVEIVDITFECNNNNYRADIKVVARKEESV